MESRDDADATEELLELERAVTKLRARLRKDSPVALVVDQDTPTFASYAQAILQGRMRIDRYLTCGYLGDPAFDMLLDLFVAAERDEKRYFKACALASRVPPATASRYIDLMARDGFVVRDPDPEDGRRTIISLTPATRAALSDWLASISSIPLRREWTE